MVSLGGEIRRKKEVERKRAVEEGINWKMRGILVTNKKSAINELQSRLEVGKSTKKHQKRDDTGGNKQRKSNSHPEHYPEKLEKTGIGIK